jgi:hypothetical protein
MTVLNMRTLAVRQSTETSSFFKRLWRSVLRFDEALNFDPQEDLVRRISDLERKSQ